MSRRGRWRHVVKRLTCEGSVQLESNAHLVIVFCQHGQLLCTADEESGTLSSEGCAVIECPAPHVHLRAAEPAEVLLIELYRESRAA
jgi:environmental stress-induced protein Ves